MTGKSESNQARRTAACAAGGRGRPQRRKADKRNAESMASAHPAPPARAPRRRPRVWWFVAATAALACLALCGAGVALGSFTLSNETASASTVAVEDRYVRVYGEGPYDAHDGWGPYYVRYTGNDQVVDLAADLEAGGGMLAGTRITSTFKLFENANDQLARVFLPDVSIFTEDPDNPLDASMFGDEGVQHGVDLIYRDRLGGDYTQGVGKASQVTSYLCLEERHLSDYVKNSTTTYRRYAGTVPNVYVPKEIESLEYLFYEEGLANNTLRLALVDEEGAWTSMDSMFRGCRNLRLPSSFRLPRQLENMDFGFYDCACVSVPEGMTLPSSLRSMQWAFEECSLNSLPQGFALNEGVQDVTGAFSRSHVVSLPDGFRVPSSVTNMNYLFQDCVSLKEVPPALLTDVTATTMYDVFAGCRSLVLPEGFRLPDQATTMSSMFSKCTSLVTLPESLVLPSKVEDIGWMFASCTSLKSLPSGFLVPDSVVKADSLFSGCSRLESLPSFSFGNSVETIPNAFRGCTHLSAELDIPISVTDMDGCFLNAGSLASAVFDEEGNRVASGTGGKYAIVARYHDPGSRLGVVNYAQSHGNANLLMTTSYDWSNWEKVYGDSAAPYSDEHGAFYLHYVGAAHEVDVQGALDAQGRLLGTPVTSTYRMFDGLDSQVKRVILPELSTVPIDSKLFGDLGPATPVEVVYRAADGADHSAEFASFPQPGNITPCLYLSREQLTPDGVNPIYQGTVPAVYVSSDIDFLRKLFFNNRSIVYVSISDRNCVGWHTLLCMFYGCTNLERLADDFQLPQRAQRLTQMFQGCCNLEALPPSFAIPEKATELDNMFYGCSSLKELPSGFAPTPETFNLSSMFQGCTSLERLPDGFRMPERALRISSLFRGCRNLVELPQGFTIPDRVEDAKSVFYGCSSLRRLPDGFGLSANATDISSMFQGCSALEGLPEGFQVPEGVTELSSLFDSCKALVSLPSDFALPNTARNVNSMFSGCQALGELPGTFTVAEGVTTARYLFYDCRALAELPTDFALPLSLKDASGMFYGCGCLASLPNGVVLHSRVTDVSDMFRSCINLTALPEGFTIPEGVTSLLDMFLGCGALGSLPSGFSLPSTLTSLSFAFSGCNSLSGELVLPASISNMGSSFSSAGTLAPKRYLEDGTLAGEGVEGKYALVVRYPANTTTQVKNYASSHGNSNLLMLEQPAVTTAAGEGFEAAPSVSADEDAALDGNAMPDADSLVEGEDAAGGLPTDGGLSDVPADGDEATGSAEEAAESSEPGLSPHAFAAEGAPLYLMWPVARGARDARRMRGDRTVRVSRRDGDVRRTDAR